MGDFVASEIPPLSSILHSFDRKRMGLRGCGPSRGRPGRSFILGIEVWSLGDRTTLVDDIVRRGV